MLEAAGVYVCGTRKIRVLEHREEQCLGKVPELALSMILIRSDTEHE